MSHETLLTVKEFADLTRVHPMSVYRRIRERRQPGVYRFGGTIRIDPTAARMGNPTSVPSGTRTPALAGLFKHV